MNPRRVAALHRELASIHQRLADELDGPVEAQPPPPVKRAKTSPQRAHALVTKAFARAGIRPPLPSPHGGK